ncbi:MAG: histidine phosphatase family protein [Leptolyngbyaceae cyanobacterium CRU_2_3]|nr:histidine phosphatase family protein [Leptolyngbyaceae cyanobacterium CRU_2_3]
MGCGSVQGTVSTPTPSAISEAVGTSPSSSSTPVTSAPPNNVAAAVQRSAIERSEDELWTLLQQADDRNFVMLIRHATAPGTGDPANFRLGDCSTQRNLSEEGRQQSIRIGEAFRSRDVPISRVLSSQWCRCLETAELMNLGKVEPFLPLNSFFSDRSKADEQTAQVQQFLLENQAVPGVVVMVSHQVNITALSDILPQSGEAVVMEIGEDNQITILGQISVSHHMDDTELHSRLRKYRFNGFWKAR